ncbi:MAG: universal stress protein [Azonexus sp.]|nr:universal stress protein [Azonexus sp.]
MNSSNLAPVSVIVVATDFSPGSYLAIERAALLARQWDADLWLLHVFDDGLWATIKNIYDAERWAAVEPILAARNRLSQLTTEVAGRYGIRVHGETRTGRVVTEIVAFASTQSAQLLVIGEHGEDWISDTVLGGTALKVLEEANIPVLVVCRPATKVDQAAGDDSPPDAGYSYLLVAVDFSEAAERAARQAILFFPEARFLLVNAYLIPFEGRMQLAGASDADIERYRAAERLRVERKMRGFIERLAAPGELRSSEQFVRQSPATAILGQAERIGADLFVIGKHGGSVVEERLLGSVTRNVLYDAGRDVLLVP